MIEHKGEARIGNKVLRPYNPGMSRQSAFVSYILELLAPLAGVNAKSMFGGYGIYYQDLMFALVDKDALYLKADAVNRVEFESRGLSAFNYQRKNQTLSLSYYQAPAEALDDSTILCQWAMASYEAALRSRHNKHAEPHNKD